VDGLQVNRWIARCNSPQTKVWANLSFTQAQDIQHEIKIVGHPLTATIPTDHTYKPAFSLSSSTNTQWWYDQFGHDTGAHSATWTYLPTSNAHPYTGPKSTKADPWVTVGISATAIYGSQGRWALYNPCGIEEAILSGNHWVHVRFTQDAWIDFSENGSYWGWKKPDFVIDPPSQPDTWQSWSKYIRPHSPHPWLSLYLKEHQQLTLLEIGYARIFLDAAKTPLASFTPPLPPTPPPPPQPPPPQSSYRTYLPVIVNHSPPPYG
jgi:hypothetical protein